MNLCHMKQGLVKKVEKELKRFRIRFRTNDGVNFETRAANALNHSATKL